MKLASKVESEGELIELAGKEMMQAQEILDAVMD